MTREEAIAMLKSKLDGHTDTSYEWCECVRMAIKALEQEPCEDAISRQAVLDLISNFILEIHSEGGRDLNAHTNDVLRQILRNVGSDRVLPSVNPQEPKTGHWILDETDNSITCDKCGCLIWANDIHNGEAYYCPNCGAKMESEGKE